jgi:hypothetical protein
MPLQRPPSHGTARRSLARIRPLTYLFTVLTLSLLAPHLADAQGVTT